MAEPASSLKKIPKKRADKIKAASARVAKHRADKTAPVLATVSGLLGTIVKDLADLIAEGDAALEHEVRTLLEVIRRFIDWAGPAVYAVMFLLGLPAMLAKSSLTAPNCMTA